MERIQKPETSDKKYRKIQLEKILINIQKEKLELENKIEILKGKLEN
jgi:hypothetical protein